VPNKDPPRKICGEFYRILLKKNLQLKHTEFLLRLTATMLSDTICRDWFRYSRNNDFNVEDKERSGAPKKFEDEELEALLRKNSCQTLAELAERS